MKTKRNFPLKRAAISAVVAAAFPMLPATTMAAGSAGVAQFIAGDVNVLRPDGKTEALSKGKALQSGESILTGNGGRAQVRFSDGGLISLQPNTEFKIANYVDEADPKQDRFLVDLLRGSMRAITGLIGKRNRENYKVTTTTATIGIRGSGFSVGYNPDGSLGITTELDGIEVCNSGGCVGLTAGESVRVISPTEAPVRTNVRATVPTPAPVQEVVTVGNQTTSDGKASIVPPPPVTAPVKQVFTDLAAAVVFTDPATSNPATESYHPEAGVAVLTSFLSGQPIDFDSVDGNNIRTQFRSTPGLTNMEKGTLGVPTDPDFVGWGSWVTGQKIVAGAATEIASVHFVMGRPTPLAQMPADNMQGTYQLAGGTAFSSLHGAGQLVGGSMTANFGAYSPGQGYGYVDLTTRFGGTDYSAMLNIDINNSKITGTSGTNVTGFFTGNNASRAAMVYSTPVENAGQVSGAAIFRQTNLSSPPQ
ncbi:FecR family protein [Polaromonas sp. YR568]|uniref:FecR family protein n=1 Tax=Polaromonas sp. YR568 TaxID=1855301 RepID=UPI0008E1D7D7|nr:FecR domain-containing protein [Polaromonas sp. YR568]SFU28954.1 FecR family protein [Polaromonas sp. YR568]